MDKGKAKIAVNDDGNTVTSIYMFRRLDEACKVHICFNMCFFVFKQATSDVRIQWRG